MKYYLFLATLFVLSRVFLWFLGLEYYFSLNWMFLADPLELRENLLQTVYYFHAFPPGMNILSGVLLKISEVYVAEMAQAFFVVCGLMTTLCLYYLFVALGFPYCLSLIISFAFSITPTSIFFENLFLYDYPVPCLLILSLVLLHKAERQDSVAYLVSFFFVCAMLGWIRSAMHLIWFVALVGIVLLKLPTRRVLLAASMPFLILLSLYLKNWFLFGNFDTQTHSGGNFNLITMYHMNPVDRKTWVKEGKISPFSGHEFCHSSRVLYTILR